MEKNFKIFNYNINNILTSLEISMALYKFHKEELVNIQSNRKFSILFNIMTKEGIWINISSLQTLDKTRMDSLEDIFKHFWYEKLSIYNALIVDKIVFRYILLDPNIGKHNVLKYPSDFDKNSELLPKGYENLPNNTKFETWGEEFIIHGNDTYEINDCDNTYFITTFDKEYFVSLRSDNTEVLNFHDIYEFDDDNTDTFIRNIGRSVLYYHKGICHLIEYNKCFYNYGEAKVNLYKYYF